MEDSHAITRLRGSEQAGAGAHNNSESLLLLHSFLGAWGQVRGPLKVLPHDLAHTGTSPASVALRICPLGRGSYIRVGSCDAQEAGR